jgi:hypothetical protein
MRRCTMHYVRKAGVAITSAAMLLGLATTLATPASAATAGDSATQAAAVTPAATRVYLGYEEDKCSKTLRVLHRNGTWVTITRGVRTTVPVAIDGGGYWYWKCGSSLEWSRGASNYRQRVKEIDVVHSTRDRDIDWYLYDVIP